MFWEALPDLWRISTRPKFQRHRASEQVSGNELRQTVTALARVIGAENSRRERPDRSRQRPMQRRWAWRNESSRFVSPQSRRFQRNPQPRQRRPHFYGNMRRGRNWEQPRGHGPWDWRSRVFPRRGSPVAVIEAPCWCLQEDWMKRRPRGVTPRVPLRGGPERSAGDPRRTPQGVCVEAPEGQPRNHKHHPN